MVKREVKCDESITTVSNEKMECTNQIIFEETFNNLNESIWTREIKIPQEPDFEFCVYRNDGNDDGIVTVNENSLRITPRILEEAYGDNSVYIGKMVLANCSSNVFEECQRDATAFHILQPVISSRLITKNSFNFRYGKIEINAKFPQGDWIFPEMYLLPRYESKDDKYAFAKVNLGVARGNERLYNEDNFSEEFGGKLLEYGIRFGISEKLQHKNVTKFKRNGPWTTDFHKYTTIWSEDGFSFFVDSTEVGFLRFEDFDQFSTRNGRVAPFDQEFYLCIGLGVGGLYIFPDNTTNGKYSKPWKNVGAKAMLNFWKAKDQWLPSWKRQSRIETSFKVKSIKIWSV
ncbi:beta-1,3-glucan-binding protein-like isoform X2 [Belonocnema kinseyi]|uniref:beta-1,3-glucan-binding protein-like isoform X2 n=1 Tax=Belonocnema kinseyi TaxID=2817044 RepID=UPI00143D2319|nr:beta-1,3-glucan-binding protein-like isoform X2 [Belonocnema kinseyi]